MGIVRASHYSCNNAGDSRDAAGEVYCLTGTSSTWLGWMTLDDRPFER